MENPLRENLELLGLKPADVFQIYRVFLIVEGHHEEVILKNLLGDELEDARTLILPMRGGRTSPPSLTRRYLRTSQMHQSS